MNCKNSHVILVVEDEVLLRDTVAHHLAVKFEVIAIGTGEEAVQAVRSLPKCDLLLTDFDLHGPLDGLDVAQAAKERYPNIPIILTTGSAGSLPRIEELLQLSRTLFLAKPFQQSELDRAIGSFFDADHNSATVNLDDPLWP